MKNWKIFWTCRIIQRADGFYRLYKNILTDQEEMIWAGWHKNVLTRESSSFWTLKEKLKS